MISGYIKWGRKMTMMEYPKIKQLGHKENKGILSSGDEIAIEEKIDGANFRFMVKSGKIIFGSRKRLLGNEDANVESKSQFKRCINFISSNIDRGHLDLLNNSYLFFGESCTKHTVNYDYNILPPYIGFDVYCFDYNKFLRPETAKVMFRDLGFDFVPILKIGKYVRSKNNPIYDAIFNRKKYPSEYAVDNLAEGIVIKNLDKQLYAKKYSEGFKERFEDTFGKAKKHTKNDNELFLETFATVHAVEKMVFKLIDEDHELDRTMMKVLPSRVWSDIWLEELLIIIEKRWVLDFLKIKKLIAKRCLNVIDRMLINNALND